MGKKRKSKDLDENSDPLAEAVKRFLRSVLLSAKNGIQATRLQGWYMQMDFYSIFKSFQDDFT